MLASEALVSFALNVFCRCSLLCPNAKPHSQAYTETLEHIVKRDGELLTIGRIAWKEGGGRAGMRAAIRVFGFLRTVPTDVHTSQFEQPRDVISNKVFCCLSGEPVTRMITIWGLYPTVFLCVCVYDFSKQI